MRRMRSHCRLRRGSCRAVEGHQALERRVERDSSGEGNRCHRDPTVDDLCLLGEAPWLLLRDELQLVLGVQPRVLVDHVERHRCPCVDLLEGGPREVRQCLHDDRRKSVDECGLDIESGHALDVRDAGALGEGGVLAVHLVQRGHVLEHERDRHQHQRLRPSRRDALDLARCRRLKPPELLGPKGTLVREGEFVGDAHLGELIADELHAPLHLLLVGIAEVFHVLPGQALGSIQDVSAAARVRGQLGDRLGDALGGGFQEAGAVVPGGHDR
mmetsp:Transcript_37259/g.98574  ORF Transcript_37259/g.98574 Transcript_37259/m.98574 type:complete len:271 (-) Transcript_37259:528-1340(-)